MPRVSLKVSHVQVWEYRSKYRTYESRDREDLDNLRGREREGLRESGAGKATPLEVSNLIYLFITYVLIAYE